MVQLIQLLTVATVLIATVSGCANRENAATAPIVESVVDGDTALIRFGDTVETVRLLGIDTPESVDPHRPEQCWGQEATAALRLLIPPGEPVAVSRDLEPRDRYGRLLVYVHRLDDGLFVNEAMLADGHADLSIFPPNTAHRAALERASRAARTAELGLWGRCNGPDQPIDPPLPMSTPAG